ncbi:hypothetical protein ATCC90586_008783 [Pythium insidiosum]|nr:hypothetical protein ATCC90586_008783 [Pythium insidiosum]
METESARVLVVGDSGVGKTTLLRAICRDAMTERDAARPHRWTTGCDVHVLVSAVALALAAASPCLERQLSDMRRPQLHRNAYIEFVDVGGHPKYDISRAMFYHDIHGLVLVHDLSNSRSHDHLRHWMTEISETQRTKGGVVAASASGGAASLASLPRLVIGNKRDLVSSHTKRAALPHELRGVESMEASAEPFSLDATALSSFLDRVVGFASAPYSQSTGFRDDATTAVDFFHPHADGLRQTKSKPPPSSPTAPAPRAAGWWR